MLYFKIAISHPREGAFKKDIKTKRVFLSHDTTIAMCREAFKLQKDSHTKAVVIIIT